MSDQVEVTQLPKCDFCDQNAEYDFATKMGPWGNGCHAHWVQFRRHTKLGIGKGQKLVVIRGER